MLIYIQSGSIILTQGVFFDFTFLCFWLGMFTLIMGLDSSSHLCPTKNAKIHIILCVLILINMILHVFELHSRLSKQLMKLISLRKSMREITVLHTDMANRNQ